jgi:hypothetical protein
MADKQAYEVDEEDLVLVLIQMGHSASEDVINTVYEQLDTEAVQQAASQGNDPDERDDYAQEEIAAQIKRMEDLPKGE